MHNCQNGTTSASLLLLSLLFYYYHYYYCYFIFLFYFSIFNLVKFSTSFVQIFYFHSFPGNNMYVAGDSNIWQNLFVISTTIEKNIFNKNSKENLLLLEDSLEFLRIKFANAWRQYQKRWSKKVDEHQ